MGPNSDSSIRFLSVRVLYDIARMACRSGAAPKPQIDFDVPLGRKFLISQPSILKRLEPYNKARSYDFRVKPFGFVQSLRRPRSKRRTIADCTL